LFAVAGDKLRAAFLIKKIKENDMSSTIKKNKGTDIQA
jgi:hypothetical protein